MAVDFNNLSSKKDNYDGNQGKLTASEWNDFVKAVQTHENSIKTLSSAKIDGVRFNGQAYTDIVPVEIDGKSYRCIDVPANRSARTVKFVWIPEGSEPNNITVAGNTSIPLSFQIYDVDVNGNPFGPKGIINVYVDDLKVYTIVNVGNGDVVNFDLMKVSSGKLSSPGSHTVKLEYDNSNKTESKYIAVNVVKLTLEVDNFKSFYESTNSSWPIAYLTNGSTLHYVIKNANAADITGNEVATYTSMSLENILKLSKHGVNNITLWNSIEIDGVTIKTDEQSFKYSYVANTNEAIIMSDVLNGDSFDLYNNINIGFTAYIPNTASGEKTIKVGLYNNDTLVFTETSVKVNVSNNVGSGSASFSLVPDTNFDKNTILGINNVRITVDSYTDITSIVINNVEVSYHEVPGYEVFFNADNMKNSNTDSHRWVSTGTQAIEMQFDNVPFIDGASGWYENSDGTSLKLRKGSYCTLDYKPFETNPAYNNGDNSGLTISIEFATSNCFKDNAPVITCLDPDTKYGFEITASNATLRSSNKALYAKFKEDTRLRLDIVIEGTKTTYSQKSWVPINPDKPAEGQKPANAPSSESMMLMYIDGVYVGLAEYGRDGGTNFKQQTPQAIVFGSDLCDLDIYKIRIYKKALNCVEIVDNFANDANGVGNKTAIALRNDIFGDAQGVKRNKPDIDLLKLAKARPELPLITVRLDDKYNSNEDESLRGELTNNKKDWQLCSFSEFANPLLKVKQTDVALNSWQANTGTIRNQGTSSMGYPWPWRNWDWKTGDTDHGTSKNDMLFYFPTLDSDAKSKTWPQYQYKWTPKSALMKKLTFKKDYASSEMCNNAICSELFTDFATMLASGKSTYVNTLLTPTMAAEWNSINDVTGAAKNSTDFRFSLKAKPCFMIQELSYNANGGDPTMIAGTAGNGKDALGMMNLIPNKNEVYYLGFKQNRWEDNDWVEKNGRVWIKTTNDDGEEIDYVTDREQAWELRENKDGVYWRYHIDPAHIDPTTGEYVNEIFDHYEARTPKDSPIFPDKDFGDIDTKTFNADKHLDAMYDQTQDICRLHNWFVDINRELATGQKIKDLYDAEEFAALKYTYGYSDEWDERYDLRDSGPDPDGNSYECWRLLRFKTEAKDYLIVDQWVLYYIWRELFWMFDSGFKNLQVYTLDGQHWGTMVRDADTALGIENTGKDYFAPHLEDTDGYKIVDGRTNYGYGVANNLYHSEELSAKGYSPVLNGQFGSIWVNIRDAWKEDIASMFKDLTSASIGGVTTSFITNKFRSHQENWCEALYNFGMRQYFAGDAYLNNISAGLGDKKHSRAQWLERAMYYRTSKYKAFDETDYMYCRRGKQFPLYVSDSKTGSNKVALPTEEQTLITFKSYIPTYVYCGGDNNQANNAFRLIDINNDNVYSTIIDVTDPKGMNLPNSTDDQNTALYGTRYMTDMGELFKYCRLTNNPQTLNMPKLRNLEFGHDSRRDGKQYWTLTDGVYSKLENNDSKVQTINLSLMTGLSVLDMTNHRSLTTISGLDKCTQLEEVYISGTDVNTLNLPQTSTIKKLYLNDKLSNLTFDNLINLEDVQIDGYDNVSSVYITNCNEYMQNKSADIITNCIDNLVAAYDPTGNNTNCTLTGINWERGSFGNNTNGRRDYEILEKLVNIKANLNGTIHVSKMSPALKIKLINKYGNVDDSSNALHVIYDSKYISSVAFNRSEYYIEPGTSSYDFSNELTFDPNDANALINTAWSIDDNTIIEVDPVTGVISRKPGELNTEYSGVVELTATITQNVPAQGYSPTLTTTTNVYLKPHVAKPGDIVYADGSFSSEIIESATPVGICFYVDPENHKNRLMHAVEFIKQSSGISWGVGKYTIENGFSGDSVITSVSPIGLDSSMYDIPNLTSYNALGIDGSEDKVIFTSGSNYINATTHKFNAIRTGGVSELGFVNANEEIKVKPNINSNAITCVKKNEIVPYGLQNTLNIINIRNSYLSGEISPEYSVVNAGYVSPDNAIPYSNGTTSEFDMLDININAVNNNTVVGESPVLSNGNVVSNSNANMDLYYPAASYCWAYQPNVSNLNDKFKEHNWFLPACGDVARIAFYSYCLYDNNDIDESLMPDYENYNKFKSINTGKYAILKNISDVITSTEYKSGNNNPCKAFKLSYNTTLGRYTSSNIWSPNESNYSMYKSANTSSNKILPICRF
jgi:hypothetical protein